MKIASSQTRWLARTAIPKVFRRTSGSAAVLTVLAAAIGVPIMSPEPNSGTNPVLAIARADCPPDCGGGPGNGGTPTGPPGGGTEFIPPSMPAMPSYEPGRGQPPLDQNNGISIYNSATPQPNQAAQPSQTPVQNQDGTYNRAANGEQQPADYNNAPNNQQINNDWQNLSNRLGQESNQPEQQSGQDGTQTNQSQKNQQEEKKTCEWVQQTLSRLDPPIPSLEDIEKVERRGSPSGDFPDPQIVVNEQDRQEARYRIALAELTQKQAYDVFKQAGLAPADCPESLQRKLAGCRTEDPQCTKPPVPNPDESQYGQYKCNLPFHTSDAWQNSADLTKYVFENFNTFFPFPTPGPFPLHERQDLVLQGPLGDEPIHVVSITENSFTFLSGPGHSEGSNRYITFTFNPSGSMPWAPHYNDFGGTDWAQAELWDLTVQAWGPLGNMSLLGDVNGIGACQLVWPRLQNNLDTKMPDRNPYAAQSRTPFHGHS